MFVINLGFEKLTKMCIYSIRLFRGIKDIRVLTHKPGVSKLGPTA